MHTTNASDNMKMSARVLAIVCILSAVLCAPPPKTNILAPHDDAVSMDQPHVAGTMNDAYPSKDGTTNDVQTVTRGESSGDAGKPRSYEEQLLVHLEKFLEAYYEIYVSPSFSEAEKITQSAKDPDADMQSDQPANEYEGFKMIRVEPTNRSLTVTMRPSENFVTPRVNGSYMDANYIKVMRER